MLLLSIFEIPEVDPYLPLRGHINYKGKQQFDLFEGLSLLMIFLIKSYCGLADLGQIPRQHTFHKY